MESAKGPWDQRLPTDHADGGPFERHRDSQTSNGWTENQEQNLHSSMRLVDRPQAARHAWESDEGFTTQWLAKQDSKNGKTDENQETSGQGP